MTRQLKIGEQPWHARVMDAMAIAAGFLRQRATEPRFSHPAETSVTLLGVRHPNCVSATRFTQGSVRR